MAIELATIQYDPSTATVLCVGHWRVQHLAMVEAEMKRLMLSPQTTITLSGAGLKSFDTSAAWLLQSLLSRFESQQIAYELTHFNDEQRSLLSLTASRILEKTIQLPKPEVPPRLERLGRRTVSQTKHCIQFFAFFGEVIVMSLSSLAKPKRLRWKALGHAIEHTGFRAIPIISLLSFLIGIVLVYQMGHQLTQYGANIFAVDLIGLAVLREFGPLLTAIIVAGRTGSSFTAQIGTMKINEEVDAINTLGLSSTELLLIPRMFGLLVALPLLTVLADIFGVFGGMVMANTMLGISFHGFLERFQEVIPLKTYILGMIKVPFFAMLIATIGCYQGLQVTGSAESVGQRTTISVVQCIFMIIVTDAVFSVIFSWYGL